MGTDAALLLHLSIPLPTSTVSAVFLAVCLGDWVLYAIEYYLAVVCKISSAALV